ncbi:MAG TPA: response regulator [Acidobacteriaceae bacterium]|jgi:DNA-binding NtrC family response regulator|nr:response regulator [Acidobacteriaceae bacterium]
MSEVTKRRIFVVDDEESIVDSLTGIFNSYGFDAIPFTDPLKAFEAAQVQCPDLLLADIIMPQLNGVDLAMQFSDLYPHCKILLLSGNANSQGLLAIAKAEGHNFYLASKPAHPRELIETIESMIN